MRCRGMVLVSMRLYVLTTAVASRLMIGHGGTDEKISPVWIRVTISASADALSSSPFGSA
jgi:hypothetical protein